MVSPLIRTCSAWVSTSGPVNRWTSLDGLGVVSTRAATAAMSASWISDLPQRAKGNRTTSEVRIWPSHM